eukprot:9877038-Alexandrium_andersonii.AAC.1
MCHWEDCGVLLDGWPCGVRVGRDDPQAIEARWDRLKIGMRVVQRLSCPEGLRGEGRETLAELLGQGRGHPWPEDPSVDRECLRFG